MTEKFGKKLVWHDEFTGDVLDSSKWTTERLMYNSALLYDNSERNLRIEDNMLHLQVNRVDDKFSTCNSVTTKHTMLFKYGYVEIRAKLPFRHGAWASFWMKSDTPFLRSQANRNNWFSEIDIFELFSKNDEVCANIHRWGNKNGEVWREMLPDVVEGRPRNFKFKNPENLINEFHVYGMLWDEHSIKFYVDDEMYLDVPIDERSTLNNNTCNDMMGFHDPHYLIINNEVFTENLRWYPDGSALTNDEPMPIDYFVDYVRVYQDDKNDTIYIDDFIFSGETLK